jgi:hypothetical protein
MNYCLIALIWYDMNDIPAKERELEEQLGMIRKLSSLEAPALYDGSQIKGGY